MENPVLDPRTFASFFECWFWSWEGEGSEGLEKARSFPEGEISKPWTPFLLNLDVKIVGSGIVDMLEFVFVGPSRTSSTETAVSLVVVILPSSLPR
jgi:hypothetical protein